MNPAAPIVPATPAPSVVLSNALLTVGILTASVLLALFLQRLFAARVRAAAKRTASEWDDVFLGSIKGLVILWFFLVGVVIVLKVVPLRPEVLQFFRKTVGVIGILSMVAFLTRLSRQAILVYIDRKVQVPSSIFKNFVTLSINLLGLLFLLDYLGVPVTSLLTALGVGGLAMALALQDTLSNLFAGLNILMTRKIRPGDYILLDSGEEGEVHDVTWRNTSIQAADNNMIIVPNAKLAASTYTNTYLPDKEMGIKVAVTVALDNDLALVERVTLETAREVMAGPERAIPGFTPLVRVSDLTDLGAHLSIIMRVKEFGNQGHLKSDFLKRLHERYRAEGIKFAVPSRFVSIDKPQS